MEEDEKKNVPVSKPEWLPLVKNSLKMRFSMTDEQLEGLCKALIDHRALIAGGFVLQAVIPEGQRNQINDQIFQR